MTISVPSAPDKPVGGRHWVSPTPSRQTTKRSTWLSRASRLAQASRHRLAQTSRLARWARMQPTARWCGHGVAALAFMLSASPLTVLDAADVTNPHRSAITDAVNIGVTNSATHALIDGVAVPSQVETVDEVRHIVIRDTFPAQSTRRYELSDAPAPAFEQVVTITTTDAGIIMANERMAVLLPSPDADAALAPIQVFGLALVHGSVLAPG